MACFDSYERSVSYRRAGENILISFGFQSAKVFGRLILKIQSVGVSGVFLTVSLTWISMSVFAPNLTFQMCWRFERSPSWTNWPVLLVSTVSFMPLCRSMAMTDRIAISNFLVSLVNISLTTSTIKLHPLRTLFGWKLRYHSPTCSLEAIFVDSVHGEIIIHFGALTIFNSLLSPGTVRTWYIEHCICNVRNVSVDGLGSP